MAAKSLRYPAGSKAVARLEQRLQRDWNLREVFKKAETIMSYVQT